MLFWLEIVSSIIISVDYVCRRDQVGVSGLQYVLRVILHLLDPTVPEFSASFVGKLVIVFLKKVSINKFF